MLPPARLVLIEDHGLVRQMLAQVITADLGLVLAAEGATLAEGRAAVAREVPDLVVLDWALPDGCGADLLREWAPRRPAVRWLLISASERGELVRSAAALGAHGFVMKRSDLGVFREALRRVLAGEVYYCPVSARVLAERMVGEGRVGAAGLTGREREVLAAYARGENVKAMAARLGMSVKTAQNHLTLVREKLGLHEPAELVRFAIRHGFADPA